MYYGGNKMLSERERLERIVKKLPTRGTNMNFDMFNEHQRAEIFNLFGKEWYKEGKKTLREKNISCADTFFKDSLFEFRAVTPELRPSELKSRIIPYIFKFTDSTDRYDQIIVSINQKSLLLSLAEELDGETPTLTKKPKLRYSNEYRSLSRNKRKAINEADRIAKMVYRNSFLEKYLDFRLYCFSSLMRNLTKKEKHTKDRLINRIFELNSINSDKTESDFYDMARLYDVAGERELVAFCGQGVLTGKEDYINISKQSMHG